jgi:hypothetical protein
LIAALGQPAENGRDLLGKRHRLECRRIVILMTPARHEPASQNYEARRQLSWFQVA